MKYEIVPTGSTEPKEYFLQEVGEEGSILTHFNELQEKLKDFYEKAIIALNKEQE